ncbi:hypothetical protein SISNIDRAFT_496291 [Sistotremastrum niveocremeum HHB9708]|uniref:DUF7330 domain-containing protein n=2 Tax=Sistotremastraceae TaxID=3402574 RepID=A0A164SYI9_9AGAM|nr:hypothetical protein SISNIDRAFT_496291 [Sistotremastrum niveocremeum HHB9708]KZT40234.1 hypothetical protein SISSUDRAFT_1118421 [Sistotremastrum suecicum HHB10207 ss-3]
MDLEHIEGTDFSEAPDGTFVQTTPPELVRSGPGQAGNGDVTNYMVITTVEPINGAWIIDPLLPVTHQIIEQPKTELESDTQGTPQLRHYAYNFYLYSCSQTVALIGFRGDPTYPKARAYINGDRLCSVSIQNPNNSIFDMVVHAEDRLVLRIPRNFTGVLRHIHHRNGIYDVALLPSRSMKRKLQLLESEEDIETSYFVGDLRNSGYLDWFSWKGSKIEFFCQRGDSELSFEDED